MLNRIDPVGPVQAYKTYEIASPIATHYRDGTCEEAGCLAHQHGWSSTPDPAKILQKLPHLTSAQAVAMAEQQAHYIRKLSGRRFTERLAESGLAEFTFEAGQQCFETHKVPLERPEFYVVRDGDWRQLGRPQMHSGPDAWVNDFAEHQDRIARVVNG